MPRHHDGPSPRLRARLPPRLRARCRYLWRDADSAGIELLSAALSLGLALNLLWPVDGGGAPPPRWGWGSIALAAGALKIAGVVAELRPPRIVGLILGAGFWSGFALSYGFAAGTPIWVPYALLALTQVWSLRQVVRP